MEWAEPALAPEKGGDPRSGEDRRNPPSPSGAHQSAMPRTEGRAGVRGKARFTHVMNHFGRDVRRKRFSAHVGEGKVERHGDGRCGNDKWMSSAW